MERDPQIAKLIREGGVVPAPEGFTDQVMSMLAGESQKKNYKPLIGKGGLIVILLTVAALIALSIAYAEPAEPSHRIAELFAGQQWKLPEFHLSFDFFRNLKVSPWMVSVLAAIFVLVLSDAGLRRKKLV
jgi:hypothetical protein